MRSEHSVLRPATWAPALVNWRAEMSTPDFSHLSYKAFIYNTGKIPWRQSKSSKLPTNLAAKHKKKNDKQTTLHCNRPTMLVKSFSKGWSRRDKDICTFAKPRHGRDLQQHAAHSRFSARLRRARCSYRMRFCGFTRLYGSRLQAACKLHAMRDAKRNGLFSASKRWFLKLYVLVIPSLRKHKPWGAACVYDSRQFCLIRTT